MPRISAPLVAGVAALSLIPLQPISAQKQASMPGLVVRMGEAWIFRVEGGQPTAARAAQPDEKPAAGELKVELRPESEMLMTVTNNTSVWYSYRASLTSGQDVEGKATSVCTLMADGRFSYELWPSSAPAIRIADFEPAEEGKMVCR